MAGTERKRTKSADGTEIYYETYTNAGEKPQILFVHGVGGDLDAWQFVREPLLAAGLSAVALDLRGSGYSGHPRKRASYGFERMNEDILSVLAAEGLERATLIGHSGGAVISLAFAAAHPEKVASLVLITPSYGPPSYAPNAAVRAFYAPFISALAFISPRAGAPWHSPYPAGKQHKEVELYGLARTIYKNSLASYLLICQALMYADFEEALAKLRMPTLLIAAERDGIYPLSIAKAMHEKIPGSVLRVVPDANHVLPLNRPQEVVQFIKEFLS